YVRFAARLMPVAALGLVLNFLVVAIVYRRLLIAPPSLTATPVRHDRHDRRRRSRAHLWLQRKSVTVTLVTVGLFFTGLPLELVARGAAALLLLGRVKPEKVYGRIDWSLLIMFAGLFIVAHAFQVHVVTTWGIEQWDWLLGRPVDLLSL